MPAPQMLAAFERLSEGSDARRLPERRKRALRRNKRWPGCAEDLLAAAQAAMAKGDEGQGSDVEALDVLDPVDDAGGGDGGDGASDAKLAAWSGRRTAAQTPSSSPRRSPRRVFDADQRRIARNFVTAVAEDWCHRGYGVCPVHGRWRSLIPFRSKAQAYQRVRYPLHPTGAPLLPASWHLCITPVPTVLLTNPARLAR